MFDLSNFFHTSYSFLDQPYNASFELLMKFGNDSNRLNAIGNGVRRKLKTIILIA